MTEAEAKTKDCCGAPAVAVAIVMASKLQATPTKGHTPGMCLGSLCMAWRWDEPWTSQTEEGHGGDITIRLKRKAGEPKLGFCGLAGAPR